MLSQPSLLNEGHRTEHTPPPEERRTPYDISRLFPGDLPRLCAGFCQQGEEIGGRRSPTGEAAGSCDLWGFGDPGAIPPGMWLVTLVTL